VSRLGRLLTNPSSWQAGLYNAASPYQPTAETGLIRLLPGLLAVISENLDMLDQMLPLLESYLLLDASGIVQVSCRWKRQGSDR
jgi:hypothetical protein